MNNEPLVSIVMPMFNSSKYLNETLKSLQKQIYKTFEVVIVDDGSTDNSVEIAEKFIRKDPRFKLIQQENSYAGVARNNGLKSIQGDYVIFLDADDIFDKKMLFSLITDSRKHNVDVIVFSYYSFSIKHINHKYTIKYAGQELNPLELKDDLFNLDSGIPWNKFYKVEYVKRVGLQFQAIPNTNDVFFTKLSLAYASKIYFSNKKLVYYRSGNPNSLQGSRIKHPDAFYTAYSELITALKSNNYFDMFYRTTKIMVIETCLGHLFAADSFELFHCMYDLSYKLFKELELTVNDEFIVNNHYDIICSIINNDFLSCVFHVYLEYREDANKRENKSFWNKVKRAAKKFLC